VDRAAFRVFAIKSWFLRFPPMTALPPSQPRPLWHCRKRKSSRPRTVFTGHGGLPFRLRRVDYTDSGNYKRWADIISRGKHPDWRKIYVYLKTRRGRHWFRAWRKQLMTMLGLKNKTRAPNPELKNEFCRFGLIGKRSNPNHGLRIPAPGVGAQRLALGGNGPK